MDYVSHIRISSHDLKTQKNTHGFLCQHGYLMGGKHPFPFHFPRPCEPAGGKLAIRRFEESSIQISFRRETGRALSFGQVFARIHRFYRFGWTDVLYARISVHR
jgi:hypothetical protein